MDGFFGNEDVSDIQKSIKELSKMAGISKSDVLRSAMFLVKLWIVETHAGGRLLIQHSNGDVYEFEQPQKGAKLTLLPGNKNPAPENPNRSNGFFGNEDVSDIQKSVEELSKIAGTSQNDVLRNAMFLLKLWIAETHADSKFFIQRSNGNIYELEQPEKGPKLTLLLGNKNSPPENPNRSRRRLQSASPKPH